MPRTKHPVIALWAVPRSASTAFEKGFSRRPDTTVVHEPFTDEYYFGANARSGRYGVSEGVRQRLSQEPTSSFLAELVARSRSLGKLAFVKDLAFQAEPFVQDSFLSQALNVFLVRRPARVYRSLHPLKPDFTEEEFGFIAAGRLMMRVASLGKPVFILDGDDFRDHPSASYSAICRAAGIRFEESMLKWPKGPVRSWADHESESQAKWHQRLEESEGVEPLQDGERERDSDALWSDEDDLHLLVIDRAREVYGDLARWRPAKAKQPVWSLGERELITVFGERIELGLERLEVGERQTGIEEERVQIRAAQPNDVGALQRVAEAAYAKYLARIGRPPAPMYESYADVVARGGLYVVDVGDRVVGYIEVCLESDAVLLENAALLPQFQGKKIAPQFYELGRRLAQETGRPRLRLYTNVKMTENIVLYKRLGFEEVGRRRVGEFDRVFMECPV